MQFIPATGCTDKKVGSYGIWGIGRCRCLCRIIQCGDKNRCFPQAAERLAAAFPLFPGLCPKKVLNGRRYECSGCHTPHCPVCRKYRPIKDWQFSCQHPAASKAFPLCRVLSCHSSRSAYGRHTRYLWPFAGKIRRSECKAQYLPAAPKPKNPM